MDARWLIWIDTGGTFTDCLARDPAGRWRACKVLSSGAVRASIRSIESSGELVIRDSPALELLRLPRDFLRGFRARFAGLVSEVNECRVEASDGLRLRLASPADGASPRSEVPASVELQSPEDAPLLAIRWLTGRRLDDELPPLELRLATTRATNALLERKGARTALFLTEGFTDLLRIGDQRRPDLFALDVRKPRPIVDDVYPAFERVSATGEVLAPLNLARALGGYEAARYDSVAVALLNAHARPDHERALAQAVREAGIGHVSISTDLASSLGYLRRAQTAAVNAYLAPVIDGYLEMVRRAMRDGGGTLHVMSSAGGLVRGERFRAKDSLLSGPAGGVMGAAGAARSAGYPRVLAFDMGGTSTDVTRIDGQPVYRFSHRVGEVELEAPCLALETVAAGGGSICRFETGQLRVGPESAGARPGPACYGAGGPLTLTDVNLLLGRLRGGRLPIPVRADLSWSVLEDVRRAMGTAAPEEPERLLEGFRRLADERMAEAIRRISVAEGYDPSEYALLAFGGAGAQHACSIARLLGMHTVLVPARGGLLSAEGLGRARLECVAERLLLKPWTAMAPELSEVWRGLQTEALDGLIAEGAAPDRVGVARRLLEMRYAGQETVLSIDVDESTDPAEAFARLHRDLYAHDPRERAIEVVQARVIAAADAARETSEIRLSHTRVPEASGTETTRLHDRGGWRDIPVFDRSSLQEGTSIQGPALIEDDYTCTVVETDWELVVQGDMLVLSRAAIPAGSDVDEAWLLQSRAIETELFSHRYEAIAREMGERLRRSAVSVNIKERLDYSCAVLDRAGLLVVNAPHIPVHLGALGLCVRSLAQAVDMGPGEVWVTNHPAYGGSHLPDVTVVGPVHSDAGNLLGFVATRAHHAEIGGSRPGSMPPDARSLAEEGVVLPPIRIVDDGVADWTEVERRLREAPFPSRSPLDNLADLRAMVAAHRWGAAALQSMARRYGDSRMIRTMEDLYVRAGGAMRNALRSWTDGVRDARELLDDGSQLAVRIEVVGDTARVDFRGSAPVQSGNLNATEAVVRSVLVYVMRVLVAEGLPLNEGLLDPITLHLPRGLLSPEFPPEAERCPAVMGGNVETSQRLVDLLFKAWGVAACSQGTMNNVSFGNDQFGYYETIAGGTGAGEGFAGESAVQSHMTNTRITDVEVVEHRYPVRLCRFEIRTNSGGQGRWAGGHGLRREYEFLAPVSVSMLGQHRTEGPYGRKGGAPGAPARTVWIPLDRDPVLLAWNAAVEVTAGDRILVETPGGGGWGAWAAPENPRDRTPASTDPRQGLADGDTLVRGFGLNVPAPLWVVLMVTRHVAKGVRHV